MTAPGAAINASSKSRRDPFIDIYRGYALLAITMNHFVLVAHDEGLSNVYSFTLTPLGLSSAAEIFVLCSGYAFALAYGRLLDRAGFAATWIKALKRAMLLLFCNLLMTVASAGVIAAFIPRKHWHAGSFQMTDTVLRHLGRVLGNMASFQWTPAYHDVLPLYALLLLVAPLQLYGLRQLPRITLALSAGAWLLAATGIVGRAQLGLPGWYFNPLAWQFLFFLGIAAARFKLLERVPSSPRAILLYLLLLLAAFAFKLAVYHGLIASASQPGIQRQGVPMGDKLTLGPLRVVHALLLAAFLAALFRLAGRSAETLLGPWLGRIGRSSLPVFVASNPTMFLCGGALALAPSAGLFYALSAALASSLLLFAFVWQQRPTRKPLSIA